MKRSIFSAAAATLTLGGTAAWADPDQIGYGGYMMNGYGHGWLGGSVMVLFWIAAIAIAVLAVRWLSQNDGKEKKTSALDILHERLARGDIDAEEYQARRKALEG